MASNNVRRRSYKGESYPYAVNWEIASYPSSYTCKWDPVSYNTSYSYTKYLDDLPTGSHQGATGLLSNDSGELVSYSFRISIPDYSSIDIAYYTSGHSYEEVDITNFGGRFSFTSSQEATYKVTLSDGNTVIGTFDEINEYSKENLGTSYSINYDYYYSLDTSGSTYFDDSYSIDADLNSFRIDVVPSSVSGLSVTINSLDIYLPIKDKANGNIFTIRPEISVINSLFPIKFSVNFY